MNKPLRIGLAVVLVALAIVAALVGSVKMPRPKVTFTYEGCSTTKVSRVFVIGVRNQTNKKLHYWASVPLVKSNNIWIPTVPGFQPPFYARSGQLQPGESCNYGQLTGSLVGDLKVKIIWGLGPPDPVPQWKTAIDSVSWKYFRFAPFSRMRLNHTNEVEAVTQSK